jgi:glycosyltransferase involved in cell wall biosynthesis
MTKIAPLPLKKIYYYNLGIHTYVQHTIANPPEGYTFLSIDDRDRKNKMNALRKNKVLAFFYKKIVKRWFNVAPLLQRVYYKPAPAEVDLILTNGTIIEEQRPWILEILDAPHSLGGNDYQVFIKNIPRFERALASPFCKRILVHTEASKKECEKYFSSEIIKKIVKITPGIPDPKIRRFYRKHPTTFLLMGSINNPSEFYIKGGLEALETFSRVARKHPESKLIVKCFVPSELREKYKIQQIEIIDRNLSSEEMHELYMKSDALLMPGHGYYLMAFLEAFSYGLPVISLDTYGVSEFVKNELNGFVIRPSEKIPYDDAQYPVSVRSEKFIEAIKTIDQRVIEDLVTATTRLIEDPALLRRMSSDTLRIFRERYTIEQKNAQLKKIFNAALSGA